MFDFQSSGVQIFLLFLGSACLMHLVAFVLQWQKTVLHNLFGSNFLQSLCGNLRKRGNMDTFQRCQMDFRKLSQRIKLLGFLLKLENNSFPAKTTITHYCVCNILHGFQILTAKFLHIFYYWYSINNEYSGENMQR